MSFNFSWKPGDFDVFVGIVSITIGYTIYWFLSISEKFKKLFFRGNNHDSNWLNYLFVVKVSGFVFMGLIPAIILLSTTSYTLDSLGLKAGDYTQSLIYTSIMGAIILVVNYFAAKGKSNLEMYPQARAIHWNLKRILYNSTGWIIYMIGYEFMFRGILLHVCINAFGFWPAVAVNLSFYSATHIAKGLRETIGTFPYGLILCLITASTGSIAVAFFTHVILAISNDIYSVKHNPEMKYS